MKNAPTLHAVVIAGGSGTRFWPLSRKKFPKQLLNLTGKGPLLAETFARVSSAVRADHQWMVVGHAYADVCREVVPDVPAAHVLVEPVARNTAPAIALAAIHLAARDPHAVMAVLPADHHVQDTAQFCAALRQATRVAQTGAIVTLGIAPTHAETGFGYIERGQEHSSGGGAAHEGAAFDVRRFCEKPNREQAERFLASGNFYWNAGIFVMQPSVFLAELERQLPDIHAAMQRIARTIDTADYARTLEHEFTAIKGISIDYGVMEQARNVVVVPVSCGWSDVGSFSALDSVIPHDAQGNVVSGRVATVDVQDCVLYADGPGVVGVVGLRDVVVVHTRDATLVVSKERAQEVRGIIELVEKRGWTEVL